MSDLRNLSSLELQEAKSKLMERYQACQSRNLKLDMTRGKPCPEQLSLSLSMLDGKDYLAEDGTDCRNYGGVDGIPEAKKLFAQYLEVEPDEIIIGGNASLALMHDTIMRAMFRGGGDGDTPWVKLPSVKFLCPCPGYDRHFSILEYFNIEMIPVEMTKSGPNMDKVGELVRDESVKGIVCVPRYSNPTGITYSDEVVDRLASMETKAGDFRIIWDNAYNAHHLADQPDRLKNILTACKQAGNPERVLIFGSTSKITFAGAGIALMAGSKKNMDQAKQQINLQTIGPDKMNQLHHVRFLKQVGGIDSLMKQHAAILKPKFDMVQNILGKELGGKYIAEWSQPKGGYFVSINTLEGCAKVVVAMAAKAGVKLTPAGATFPYGKDPQDRNIRIAPSFPSVDEIRQAMELLAICIQVVSIEKIMQNAGR
jgi:DNA-binding transcriptional MocR family regulator